MDSVSSSDVAAKSVMGGFLQPGVWCDLEVGKPVEGVSKDLQHPVTLTDGHSIYLPRGEEPVNTPSISSTHILIHSK